MVQVSVVLPVFNGERFLPESIESILCQSIEELELIVVDDGSTDGTSAILKSLSDTRLRVCRFGENRGLIAALNEGIRLSRAGFIARMDADDVSEPTRLEMQVRYLESHPDIDALGTSIYRIDDAGTVLDTVAFGTTPRVFRARALMGAWSAAHGSVMFRCSDRFRPHYEIEHLHCEDLALWLAISRRMAMCCLDEPLYRLRLHRGRVTERFRDTQTRGGLGIYQKEFHREGLCCGDDEVLRVFLSYSADLRPSKWGSLRRFIQQVGERCLTQGLFQHGRESTGCIKAKQRLCLEQCWLSLGWLYFGSVVVHDPKAIFGIKYWRRMAGHIVRVMLGRGTR